MPVAADSDTDSLDSELVASAGLSARLAAGPLLDADDPIELSDDNDDAGSEETPASAQAASSPPVQLPPPSISEGQAAAPAPSQATDAGPTTMSETAPQSD